MTVCIQDKVCKHIYFDYANTCVNESSIFGYDAAVMHTQTM